jgi:hypothetical protein
MEKLFEKLDVQIKLGTFPSETDNSKERDNADSA